MISSTSRLPSICTLALALWPDLTVRIKQLIFSHFSQHSQHKPRHGLSAGQTYRLRGIRSGLECHRPPGREESRIKETTQCFSKSGQQQESLQRAQDDALLSTRERLIMSGHITGIIGLPSDTSLWLCDSLTLWWCEREGGALAGAGAGDTELEYRLSPWQTDYFPHTNYKHWYCCHFILSPPPVSGILSNSLSLPFFHWTTFPIFHFIQTGRSRCSDVNFHKPPPPLTLFW